jgi:hypothetical protein
MPEKADRKWVTRLTRLGDDDASVDREVIAQMSPEERVERVWALVLRYGELIGVDYSQQRLQRSVACLRRA